LEWNKEGRLRTFLNVGQITEEKRQALNEILDGIHRDLLELNRRWDRKALLVIEMNCHLS
jgi:hypothetical protein